MRTIQLPEKPRPEEKEDEKKPDEEPKKEAIVEPEAEKRVKIEIPVEKTVEQVTNEEEPTEAKFVSSQANKVEEETRAVDTTLKDVIPSNTPTEIIDDAGSPDPDTQRSDRNEDPAMASDAMAMAVKQQTSSERNEPERSKDVEKQTVEDREKNQDVSEDGVRKVEEETTSPVVKDENNDGPKAKVDPKRLFGPPSVTDYERVFGDDQPNPKSDGSGKKRRRMFTRHAEKQRALKGSLENMIPEIKPGNHTSVNAHRSVYAGYISSLHRRIHARWANQFLVMLDTQYPRSHPLQNPSLSTTLEFKIDARTGEFESIIPVQGSGELMFDAEAISVAWGIGPRPNPPPQIVSPDGKIYIHWTFWRDGRQCGVFGASIYLM
ncbi:unnamed protein product, partial [Laminaria digitata]